MRENYGRAVGSRQCYRSDRLREAAAGIRLLHDAAHVDGPEAARRIWQEARAHHRAARFLVTMHAWPLIEMLLGTGVPDMIEVIIGEWLESAEQAGESDVPVTEDEHRIFELALAEIAGSLKRGPGHSRCPSP